MFSLVAVSVDRYWAICRPVTYHVRSTTTTKIIIVFCWITGFLFGFLPMFGLNSGKLNNECDLRAIVDFNYILGICVTVAPSCAIIIIVLYYRIYRAVVNQVRRKNHETLSTINNNSCTLQAKRRQSIIVKTPELTTQKNEIKAAKTLAMVVGTYFILWVPGTISFLIMAITNNRNFHKPTLEISTILVHVNSAIDPLIYAYRMRKVREALRQLFNCYQSS